MEEDYLNSPASINVGSCWHQEQWVEAWPASGAGQELQCWVCRDEPRTHCQRRSGWLERDSELGSTPHPTAPVPTSPHPTLTHTLIPLVVLHVALGTATAVASKHILAAMLAPMVSITLIHICSNVTQQTAVRQIPVLWAAPGAQGPRAPGTRLGIVIHQCVHVGGWFFCLIIALQLGLE